MCGNQTSARSSTAPRLQSVLLPVVLVQALAVEVRLSAALVPVEVSELVVLVVMLSVIRAD
jgi:hypothetical protein